jgi:WD40 repeat protein
MSLAFSPDGRMIVTGSMDRTVRLWDPHTGTLLRTLAGHTDWVYSVAFSPDGETIVSGSSDNTVRLWDAQTGRSLLTISGLWAGVTAVAFSPDGLKIAVASGDFVIRFWDPRTGAWMGALAGHWSRVTSLAFSADGRTIVTGAYDDLRFWDVASGAMLRRYDRHISGVAMIVISPDGQSFGISGTISGVAKFPELELARNASYSVVHGVEQGENDLAKLSVDDDVYAEVQQQRPVAPLIPSAELRVMVAVPVGNPIKSGLLTVRVKANGGSFSPTVRRQEIALRDWASGSFVTVDSRRPSSRSAGEPLVEVTLDEQLRGFGKGLRP